jgi:hypothetical protein
MSTETTPVVRLGQVRATRDHDYLQFFFALLAFIAVICGLGWAWKSTTYLQYAHDAIGLPFTVAFSVLLAYGLFNGLIQSWKVSRSINMVKRCSSIAELHTFFGFELNSKVSTDYLNDVIADDLERRIDGIEYAKRLSVMVGFFGTVVGIMLVVGSLQDVRSADDVFKALPGIAHGLKVAFGTTLVGIIVGVIVGQMARLVRNAAMMLKARILRVLQQT